jgi:DNA-directed RNA polymerase subunit RPC12/RpoP
MPYYYIDYPQEEDGAMHSYRCKHCKLNTLVINGLLENHEPHCSYRIEREVELHKAMLIGQQAKIVLGGVDEAD